MDIAIKGAIDSVSALHPALTVLEAAWEYYSQVKYSKARCKALVLRAQRILRTISQAMVENRCSPTKTDFEKLYRNLVFVQHVMMEQSRMNFLKSLFRLDDISDSLDTATQDLDDCLECFKIQRQAEIHEHQIENEEARRIDMAELRNLMNQLLVNDDKMLQKLDVKDNQIEETMHVMQREIRRAPEGSPQRELLAGGVACLQRSSGKVAPKELPRWLITALDVDIDDTSKLGGGGFAEVFKGRWRGSSVAIKRLRSAGLDDLKREADIWYGLRHDNIVPFYGASITANPPFMVSRYMRNGHILTYLRTYPKENRVRLIYEVSLGMRYLHDERVVHGDLKGVNVLVDDSGHACISDFGLSTVIKSATNKDQSKPAVGTLRFMAPEAIKTGNLTTATDVYAFGMLIYETFTGEPPFLAEPDVDVAAGTVTLSRPIDQVFLDRGLTDEMWALLHECSDKLPSMRPNFAKITTKTATLANRWMANPNAVSDTAGDHIQSASRSDGYTGRTLVSEDAFTGRTVVPGDSTPTSPSQGPYRSRGLAIQPSPSRDIPPFRIELDVIRDHAELRLDSDGTPVTVSYGIVYPCHPEKGTLAFAGETYFYVHAEQNTDKEKWELVGSKITQVGPGVDSDLQFENAEHAKQWFQAMIRFARGKDMKPRFRSFRQGVECPAVSVRWRIGGIGWRRILGGRIQCAPWEEIVRGRVPADDKWVPLVMPLRCSVTASQSTSTSFSFVADYEEDSPRFWTVTLSERQIKKEGRPSESAKALFIQEERCDTAEHASTWFRVFQSIMTDLSAKSALTSATL